MYKTLEQKKMKGYTLAELKKKYAEMSKKKGYRGWYEATKKDAGNVPLNNAIFNMMMGSAKSVNMAQVNADNFVGDAPVTSNAPVAAPDGGIGMVGIAEDINNEPLTLKVTFDDGDYLVTQYEGTLRKARDQFVGRAIKWEDEPANAEKTGVDVKLVSTTNHPLKNANARIQESVGSSRVDEVIRGLGVVARLAAEDWIALRDDPKFGAEKEDLWMYGNEVRALMDYVFMDGHSYNANEIQQDYRGSLGVSVVRVLKELSKREYSDWKANADAKSAELDDKLKKADPFNSLDEGFNGDEHALIERISNLKDGEILRLKNFHNDASLEEPLDMCIKKNSKFPGRYILWNEGKNSGEKLNVINFSSLNNAVEWAKQTDEFLTESKRK